MDRSVPSSSNGNVGLCSWIILLKEERKHEHDGGQYRQYPERVDISHCVRLPINLSIEKCDCMATCVMGCHSRMSQP